MAKIRNQDLKVEIKNTVVRIQAVETKLLISEAGYSLLHNKTSEGTTE
jgi:hypothetical protein